MAKKKKKSWKKKLLKAALIGGALYGGSKLLGKMRGKSVEDTAASEDENINVTHPALTGDSGYITKKSDVVAPIITSPGSGDGGIHQGKPPKINPWRGVAPGPPGILNPWTHIPGGGHPRRPGGKGGGIAKRGSGAAYKKGGRVTGIAKRGFGRALMKGKK